MKCHKGQIANMYCRPHGCKCICCSEQWLTEHCLIWLPPKYNGQRNSCWLETMAMFVIAYSKEPTHDNIQYNSVITTAVADSSRRCSQPTMSTHTTTQLCYIEQKLIKLSQKTFRLLSEKNMWLHVVQQSEQLVSNYNNFWRTQQLVMRHSSNCISVYHSV